MLPWLLDIGATSTTTLSKRALGHVEGVNLWVHNLKHICANLDNNLSFEVLKIKQGQRIMIITFVAPTIAAPRQKCERKSNYPVFIFFLVGGAQIM